MSHTDTTPNKSVKSQVMDRLQNVWDPCSCHTDEPISIVDLGLVTKDEIEVKDGEAHINLTPTSPMCLYVLQMSDEIKDRVGELKMIDEVKVTQEREEIWTPERMVDEARQDRKEIFKKRVEEAEMEPYYS